MKGLGIFILLLLPQILFSQKFTVSGYIKDATDGEDLIGANVFVKTDVTKGTTANAYGFYSLTLPAGEYTLVFQYLGYSKQEKTINLNQDVRLNVNLAPESTQLQEITVTSERKDANIQTTEMGTTQLQMEDVKQLPALMGEVDILKTLQLLPGVQSAGEGNTGLYVRGGGPDQNLVLLDNAVVYNPGHLFGFFSVFNSDAIKNTTLIKGGMPANYGGRLSAVVDVAMKEGNNKNYEAEGGIGLISSKLTLHGPIIKDKSSFMISGRRTYADVLVRPFLKGTRYEGNAYYFYDLNAKANYRFSDKDRLYLSGYFGRDVFNYRSSDSDFRISIPWGNATGTLRWNHLFSDKLFMNTSLIYNNYDFTTEGGQSSFNFKFFSSIEDVNAKVDFDYFASASSSFKFGVDYIFHAFEPISVSFVSEDEDLNLTTDRVTTKYAHEAAAYVLWEKDISSRFRINAGLRYSAFQQVGPYTYYKEDETEKIVDTIEYGRLEGIKTYSGAEPRFGIRYLINEYSSVKGSVTFTKQYLHLVSNSSTTLPTDTWVPSSILVEPQNAIQYALGYFRNFRDNKYETSVEFYYKDLQNQIEYEDGYTPQLNVEEERSFVFGRGYSYGAELFIKKRTGNLNGWIGYTWSKTMRKFDEINQGKAFPAKFDRRHDLAIVASYDLNKRWTFSGTFVYGTGNAFTIPESWYIVEGNIIAEYGARNAYRLAPYHRLDLAAVLHGKEKKRFQSDWVFAIYNVYSRLNPFFIYFENEGSVFEGTSSLKAKQVSIFPIIPSITWNFRIK